MIRSATSNQFACSATPCGKLCLLKIRQLSKYSLNIYHVYVFIVSYYFSRLKTVKTLRKCHIGLEKKKKQIFILFIYLFVYLFIYLLAKRRPYLKIFNPLNINLEASRLAHVTDCLPERFSIPFPRPV